MTYPLDSYERWMVRSNIEHAQTEGADVIVAQLRANGYGRVADAVERELQAEAKIRAELLGLTPQRAESP